MYSTVMEAGSLLSSLLCYILKEVSFNFVVLFINKYITCFHECIYNNAKSNVYILPDLVLHISLLFVPH